MLPSQFNVKTPYHYLSADFYCVINCDAKICCPHPSQECLNRKLSDCYLKEIAEKLSDHKVSLFCLLLTKERLLLINRLESSSSLSIGISTFLCSRSSKFPGSRQ